MRRAAPSGQRSTFLEKNRQTSSPSLVTQMGVPSPSLNHSVLQFVQVRRKEACIYC